MSMRCDVRLAHQPQNFKGPLRQKRRHGKKKEPPREMLQTFCSEIGMYTFDLDLLTANIVSYLQ